MELTKRAPDGQLQVVQSYGQGGFKVSGVRHQGSILVLPGATISWDVTSASDLSLPSLQAVIDADKPPIELLIFGCGPALTMVPTTLRDVLQVKGIGFEAMDTGAACRTYNVLAGEGRQVAAALIAL